MARGDKRIGSAGIPEDRVSANAWENFSEATVLTIPAEFEADTEVTVVIEGTSTEAAAQHLVIVAERFSKAIVVLNHQGSAVVSENIEIVVEDGANLTVVSLQEWNDDAVHASSQQAKIGRDSKFKHVVVSLGGDLVRVTPSTRFTARAAKRKCSACTSPTPASTWSSGSLLTMRWRTALPMCSTRARCRAVTPTPCG
ncbi:UPF0051 protein ML0594 [Arthrobacter sp. Hiyo4]|nr:UPF0051 protein ML0594 [Arthrobacter sp. Hiyo4]